MGQLTSWQMGHGKERCDGCDTDRGVADAAG